MRIRDLFSKIRDLFGNTKPKKQQVQLNPLNPLVWRLCTYTLAPNGPEKWGCRIRDLFSKIRDLFSKFETYAVIRDYETKKTAGAAEPPEPPSLAPMHMH